MAIFHILAVIVPFASLLVVYAFCEWARCTPKCLSVCRRFRLSHTQTTPATPVAIAHSVSTPADPQTSPSSVSASLPWLCPPGIVSTWPLPSTSPIGHAVFQIQLHTHYHGLAWIGIHEIAHSCINHSVFQGGTRIVFDRDQVIIQHQGQVVTSFVLDAHFFNNELHVCRVMLSARRLQIDLYPENPRSIPQILSCLLPEDREHSLDWNHIQGCVHVYSDALLGYPITQFSFRNIIQEENANVSVVFPSH